MKQCAPATARNREPIREVLARHLPERGRVLELASGTGEHAVHMARAFPALRWQPSDLDPVALASIESWRMEAGLPNLSPPIVLDVTAPVWPVTDIDAVVCINMVHIAPWEATLALMAGAPRILPAGGVLVTYGPYMRGGAHTSPSNEAFDASLRARNPLWGVRDIDKVAEVAGHEGLALEEVVPMPANNFTLVWRRQATARDDRRA